MHDLTQDVATPRWSSALHDVYQSELVVRWRMALQTLEGWRQCGKRPPFVSIYGRVRYRLEVSEAYEAAHLRGQDWRR